MRLAYITAQFPWSKGESFLLAEARELLRRGTELFVIPIHPDASVPEDRADMRGCSIATAVLSDALLPGAFRSAKAARVRSLANCVRVTGCGTAIARMKNLVVYPKALWLADMVRRNEIEHIHALWASTSATAAMIASDLTGIPWSFSAHRGDLESPNILKTKVQSARFVRCISEDGRRHALSLAGDEFASKMVVRHLGVTVPSQNRYQPGTDAAIVGLCAAALIPRKGQVYLLNALRGLLEKGRDIRIWFAGRGPDEGSLRRHAAGLIERGLVRFLGHLSHADLLALYQRQEVGFVVLPSLHEGIPVALMEAMAHGVPVISTDVGGTGELLRDGAGILVPPRDHQALAAAIARLLANSKERATLSTLGYKRVREEFEIQQTTAALELLCRQHAPYRNVASAVA